MSPRKISEHENALGEVVKSYQVGRRVASVVMLDDRKASVSLFALDLKGRRVPIVVDLNGNLAEMFYDVADLDAMFAGLEALSPPPAYPESLVMTAEQLSVLLDAPVIAT